MKNLLNTITNIDCLAGLKEIPTKSIDLVVTSPPYNLSISYDTYNDSQSPTDYFSFIKKIAIELFRVLKNDGRVCLNIPLDGSMFVDKKKIKIDIIYKMKEIFYTAGFKYKDQILWDKEHLSSHTAWGSYESASCPNILLPFEAILVFYKETKFKQSQSFCKEIIGSDFQLFTNGHWRIKGVNISKNKKLCPVPFPQELVKRLLLLYSYRNDIVLDPFSGNGTTCIVAKKLARQFIGFELSEYYYSESLKKLNNI